MRRWTRTRAAATTEALAGCRRAVPGRIPVHRRGGRRRGHRKSHLRRRVDRRRPASWFTEQCLSNALRLETYVQDAERDGDSELMEFFRRAQAESKKGADQGKSMLAKRLSG
jgi:hypothetical protein